MSAERKIFFVISPSPRSGSTLLLKCINSHPLCEGKAYYENYVVSKMLDTLDWLDANESMKRHFLIDHPADNVRNIREFVFKSMVNESPLMGMKFTHFQNFRFLKTIFPEARVVVIQRDPLDTYCSYLDLRAKQGERRISADAWFKKYIVPFYQRLPPNHDFHFLHYENLIRDFGPEMGKVWDHLGVPRPDVRAAALVEVFRERHFSASPPELDARGICATRVGRHRTDLSPAEAVVIRNLMAELKSATSYDPGNLYA